MGTKQSDSFVGDRIQGTGQLADQLGWYSKTLEAICYMGLAHSELWEPSCQCTVPYSSIHIMDGLGHAAASHFATHGFSGIPLKSLTLKS